MYDLIVIGGGPAGYVAAENAGALGKKVLLFEKDELGGVCLNRGCIPTKTMLYSAKLYRHALDGEACGVRCGDVRFEYARVFERKNRIVGGLVKGIEGLMKRHKVEVVKAEAEIVDASTVRAGGETYSTQNILIATGSVPARPPIDGIDSALVLDSTGILALTEKPASLVIVGGGVIGLEFACFFSAIGTSVVVVEMLPEIAAGLDRDVIKPLQNDLKKRGVTFHLDARVTKIDGGAVSFDKKGKTETVEGDYVLMATGRKLVVDGLGLEKINLDFDRSGIRIDEFCRTNVPNVYAAGDVTGKLLLAHVASRQATVAVDAMFGRENRMRYDAIPSVIYTFPEVAAAGLTEAEAEKRGIAAEVAKLPMTINGRFLAENEGERGTCKVVIDKNDRRLLGVHMIGSHCSEMIAAASAMIEGEFRAHEIRDIVFPHPTVSEIVHDTISTLV